MDDVEDENENRQDGSDIESEKQEPHLASSQDNQPEINPPATEIRQSGPKETAKKVFRSPKKILQKRKATEDPRIDEAFGILKKCASGSQVKDDCTTFGEYMASKLRKLDDHHRALAEHKINNILFEVQMQQLSAQKHSSQNPQASSSLSQGFVHSNPFASHTLVHSSSTNQYSTTHTSKPTRLHSAAQTFNYLENLDEAIPSTVSTPATSPSPLCQYFETYSESSNYSDSA